MVALTTKVMFVSCLVLVIGIYIYPRDDHSFDYFYLALQWPASVCHEAAGSNVTCIKPLPGNFTIHGLWAQKKIKNHKPKSYDCNSTTRNIRICRKHPFNYDELKNDRKLMEMMNERWPNLINGSSSPDQQNKKFWKKEWEKHGCCLFNFKSHQNDYFKKTCGMWKQAPLLQIFAAQKPPITPGRKKKYSLRQYIEAIRRSEVRRGAFKCSKNKPKRLVEVRLCTDKEVTKFVDCPGRILTVVSRSCGTKYSTKNIAFPISYT
ncbi:hypothetical protein F2P56_023821 [Juglans regia]|uniref:Ribonuclease S-7-like n=2 Tax=Juglans regia TaxID=51240 RepID=A0A2I4G6Y5_JUGRE|nr:ribonuclease S-7-like [Juglans regia]KAF5454133.1 hypothetical protein F2P56_023821 [Juglans regia]